MEPHVRSLRSFLRSIAFAANFLQTRRRMEREGPILESLTRRLAEAPEEFLADPRIGSSGRVEVAAVVGDLLASFGAPVTTEALDRFEGHDAGRDRNRLRVTLVLCWLLADDWFRHATLQLNHLLNLLDQEASALASHAAARKFVHEPERREELARLALARLGFRPATETIAQAQDRLATLNSAERARVMKAARLAEERARQIREALARQAAEQAADKYTRE